MLNRTTLQPFCAFLLAGITACGDAPQQPVVANEQNLQQVSFTGFADPLTGQVQIVLGPPTAIGPIAEDGNGAPGSAAPDTVQVYSPAVARFIAKGAAGYPAGCTSATAMVADVEVRSGFKEQLRNVYARITSKSAGPTFCAVAARGAIAPPANSYSGLYFYQPLNSGTGNNAIARTLPWSLNLPNNSPFWFSGDLWAEIIPQPPVLTFPADNVTILTNGSSSQIALTWTDDPRADGQNNESYAVPTPLGGASYSVKLCGTATVTAGVTSPFDSATCTTNFINPTWNPFKVPLKQVRYNAGFWYQWSVRTSFLLPGSSTQTLGNTIVTRHFAVVRR